MSDINGKTIEDSRGKIIHGGCQSLTGLWKLRTTLWKLLSYTLVMYALYLCYTLIKNLRNIELKI